MSGSARRRPQSAGGEVRLRHLLRDGAIGSRPPYDGIVLRLFFLRAASGEAAVTATERIALRRATATVREGSIVVRPARGQLLAAAAQLALAAGAVAAIALFLDRLPYWLLAALLLAAVFLGPVAALGFVFAVFGSSVVVDGRKRAAHWQQGFLGLGIGTTTSVPFGRIGHVAVSGDHDAAGADGEPPEVVTWLVELVRDDGRRFELGAVLAARPLAAEGHARARRLADAVGALAEAEVRAGPPPAAADPEAAARPRRRRIARARRRRDGERG